jgi:hypothetical protein
MDVKRFFYKEVFSFTSGIEYGKKIFYKKINKKNFFFKSINRFLIMKRCLIVYKSVSFVFLFLVKIYCSEDYISSKTIFVFWTGDNSMSVQRKECFNKLVNKSGCKVILTTRGNLNNWILPEAPLHPAFEYLSFTHKVDYLRTYFMHFYGGGGILISRPLQTIG